MEDQIQTLAPALEHDRLNCPRPGVYPGISFDEYAGWDALNNSGLSQFLVSPAHFKANRDRDDETKDKTRGTVCHAGILEPERFDREYAIGPCVKLNTKAGKDQWEAFAAAHPGKVHVRGEDGAAMLGARQAIWSHPEARRLLASPGPTEVCLVWDDPETGIRCKCRCDKLARHFGFVVDLKTTGDAKPRPFARSVHEHGYHRQAAFNLRGMRALGMTALSLTYDGFAVIAVEKEPPYGLIVYDLIYCLEQGETEVRDGVRGFAACLETGNWPCYPNAVRTLRLPKWAGRDDFEDDDNEVNGGVS